MSSFRALSATTIEILPLLVGLMAAAAITGAAAWSYPLGQDVIWWCGSAAMVATVAMGIRPLRRAWTREHASRGTDRREQE